MRFVGIETYNPAEITYPEHVREVLIVNNTVAQPPESGYEYKLLGVLQDTCKAHADSALVAACRALSEAVFEANFFHNVLLLHENMRDDNEFLFDRKLTREQVEALCAETGADAVISFDRLLFNMTKNVMKFPDGYSFGTIKVEVQGVVRSYIPTRETPQATALVADSLFWNEEAGMMDSIDRFLPTPDEALRVAGDYIGRKAYAIFVPHWDNDDRWYYTGVGTPWKEASAYAANNKWKEASEYWARIHANSRGWEAKAKSASNLALANEILGNLEKALEWATLSYELYEKNKGKDHQYTQFQLLYKEMLSRRIMSDNKLNKQI
jgi:hypothetical protein